MIVERMAARLDGRPHAVLAATVIVARGQSLLDLPAFARLLRVPAAHVRSWESGVRPPEHVPRRVRALAPDLDWEAAGVTRVADPATRHPSAHQVQTARHG